MLRICLLLLFLFSPVKAGESVIRPGDTIHLLLPTPVIEGVGISNFYRVGVDGTINLPFVGKVKVSGLTCQDAARTIDDNCLAKEINSHRAAAVKIGGPEPFVTVQGQIKHPGPVTIHPRLTLLQAITAAGGFTESADQKSVRLERAADGNTIRCNVMTIIRRPELDIILNAGDKVDVIRSER